MHYRNLPKPHGLTWVCWDKKHGLHVFQDKKRRPLSVVYLTEYEASRPALAESRLENKQSRSLDWMTRRLECADSASKARLSNEVLIGLGYQGSLESKAIRRFLARIDIAARWKRELIDTLCD